MATIDDLAKVIWDFNTQHSPIPQADCILVLCSNDLRVADRGAELFLEGRAPLIIFSGNVGKITEGMWNKPEADIFAKRAIQLGVPSGSILIENRSTNTGENILFAKELLELQGISPRSFILVQKPYMQLRALSTFKKVFPNRQVVATTVDIPFEAYPNDILTKEHIINTMVGDLQRLQLYPLKGFSIPVEIPQKVLDAYQELIRRGYDKHLIQPV